MNSKVIAISGVTGAGKTTVANALGQVLNATVVRWDDFDEISISPSDYVDWYFRGQDYHEWNYQALADILKSLKSNQPVRHPIFKKILQPTVYIIFDAPLGRLHTQTGFHIDTCIHLSLPLDVSLCRRMIRDFNGNDKTKEQLLMELKYYLSHSRLLFVDDDLKANADLVIDGILTTEDQIKGIMEYLKKGRS